MKSGACGQLCSSYWRNLEARIATNVSTDRNTANAAPLVFSPVKPWGRSDGSTRSSRNLFFKRDLFTIRTLLYHTILKKQVSRVWCTIRYILDKIIEILYCFSSQLHKEVGFIIDNWLAVSNQLSTPPGALSPTPLPGERPVFFLYIVSL